jgi:hypothetical protein
MKKQLTARQTDLTALVQQLKDQSLMKKDMVVPASSLRFEGGKLQIIGEPDDDKIVALLQDTGVSAKVAGLTFATLDVLPHFHTQVGSKLDIPKAYYDRMLPELPLLDENVNYWLKKKGNANFLIRSFIDKDEKSGIARAFLSDRYNIMDNYDVLFASLDAIRQSGKNVEIEYADITETKLYIRFICPDVEVNAPELLKNYSVTKGSRYNGRPTVVSGFVISNSEVGNGRFSISPRALILACDNGMIRKDDAFNKVHLGAKLESGTSINWSAETRSKNVELVMSQVKDAIGTFLQQEYLENWIQSLTEKGTKELEHPSDAIKNTAKLLNLSETEEQSIMKFFIKGNQTTAFGIAQAVTLHAQDVDADRQFELESIACDVIENLKMIDRPFITKAKAVKGGASNPSLN